MSEVSESILRAQSRHWPVRVEINLKDLNT